MSSRTLFRWSGIAVLLCGALFVPAHLLKEIIGSGIMQYTHPLYVPTGLIDSIRSLLLLLGLPGLYAYQADRAGRLGLVSFVMTFLGLAALEVGTIPMYTFIPPLLVAHPDTQALLTAEGGLDTQLGPLFMAYAAPAMLALNLGLILYGIATLRARVFPRFAAACIIVGPIALFTVAGLVPFGELIALGVVMLGFVWCGLLLARAPIAFQVSAKPLASQA